jgi:hypothetical protein
VRFDDRSRSRRCSRLRRLADPLARALVGARCKSDACRDARAARRACVGSRALAQASHGESDETDQWIATTRRSGIDAQPSATARLQSRGDRSPLDADNAQPSTARRSSSLHAARGRPRAAAGSDLDSPMVRAFALAQSRR